MFGLESEANVQTRVICVFMLIKRLMGYSLMLPEMTA
jgi:hypothetical protein